jgi:hypothetical protein
MYPGRADMLCPTSTVRFVPTLDLCSESFEHLEATKSNSGHCSFSYYRVYFGRQEVAMKTYDLMAIGSGTAAQVIESSGRDGGAYN